MTDLTNMPKYDDDRGVVNAIARVIYSNPMTAILGVFLGVTAMALPSLSKVAYLYCTGSVQ